MTTDPMDGPDPTKAPLCTAHNRSGGPCRKYASPGTTVCRNHGSAAPQVQAKARQRLLQALDPAAAELVRIAKEGKKEAVRVRAIEAIMDRAGLPREEVVTTDAEIHVSLHQALAPKKKEKEGEA